MRSIALKIWRTCAVLSVIMLVSSVPSRDALADHVEAKQKIQTIADQWQTDLANGQNSAAELFQRHLRPMIFLEGVAYFVTRPHWNDASPVEKDEFLRVFTKKVEKDYECAIERYFSLVSIVIEEAKELTGGSSVVYTRIQRVGRQPVLLIWKFMKDTDQVLRLFDVNAEGYSLVQTYRNEFPDILRRSGLTGLTSELEKKIIDERPCPPLN